MITYVAILLLIFFGALMLFLSYKKLQYEIRILKITQRIEEKEALKQPLFDTVPSKKTEVKRPKKGKRELK
jgi:cell division protein FtsL